MRRISTIVATLLVLVGVTVVMTAGASWASVCQPNGTGCTASGGYSGPNAVINSNSSGFKVVWVKSAVQQYSSGVPLYWTAYVTYTNTSPSTLTLTCPPESSIQQISEHMSGGSGDDGTVNAASSNCSGHPNQSVTVSPGGSYTDWATFHNVPWPGSAVAITWGNVGTSPYVYPFQSISALAQPTAEWSGYGMYPNVQGYTVTHVSALWVVPKVTCPTKGISSHGAWGPRAAVWVGLTGTLESIFTAGTAWLPQIGTDSNCVNGKPQYSGVYELYHACNLHDILACFQGEQAINNFKVNGGDTVYASVVYNGSTSAGAQQFQLTLVDYASGGSGTKVTENVKTSSDVPLLDVARQGVAIVENVDESTAAGIPIPGTGGLAQFKQPVEFVQYAVNGEPPGGLSAIQYEMLKGNGSRLATNSHPLGGNPAMGTGNFTVTWNAQN
jgi:hypothetical protein